jgi:hypothetical protein
MPSSGRLTQVALGVAAAGVLSAAVLVLVLAPAGHDRVEDAIPRDARVAARGRADGVEVLVLTSGARMRLAAGYEDIKGWRLTSTPYVARTEAVVWARLSRRGTNVSAVYGRIDGPPPTVVWADGRRQQAVAGSESGVYLAVRAGTHGCRQVEGVGQPPTTYDCGDE